MSPSIHSLSYSLVMRWSHSQHWMHKQIHTHYDTKPVIQSQKKSSEASLASWRWKSKKSFPPYFSDATPMPLQWFPICPGKEEVLKGEISPTALGVSQLRIWPVFTNIFLATGHSNRGYWEWGWGKGSSEVSFRFFAVISLLFTLWFFFFLLWALVGILPLFWSLMPLVLFPRAHTLQLCVRSAAETSRNPY